MALRLSKIWTFGKALYHMTMRLKEYTDETITPQGWAEIINLKLMQAQEILGLKNSEEFKEPIVITPEIYANGGYWPSASTIAWTAASRNLLVPTGMFATNFTPGFTNFNTTNPLGARLLITLNISTPGIPGNGIVEMVISKAIDANNIQTDRAPAAGDLPDGQYPGVLIIPGGLDAINLATYAIYKNIREIILIESNTTGECVYKDKTEFLNITKPPIGTYHSHWLNRIIWTRDGELIKLAKGTLSEYGALTMWIMRTPYECDITSPDEYLDARDGDMNIIFDMALLTGLETLKIPIPQNLKSSEDTINKLIQANDAQKAKLLTNQK